MFNPVNFSVIPEILYLTMDDVKSVGLLDEDYFNIVMSAFVRDEMSQNGSSDDRYICFDHNSAFYFSSGSVSSLGITGIEWSALYQKNEEQGFHSSPGMIILNDSTNGLPYAIMDSYFITVKAVAAATAIAAKYLARTDSAVLGIIGANGQSMNDLRLLRLVLPELNRVKIYDGQDGAAENFQRTMGDEFRGEITVADTIQETVTNVDLVISGWPGLPVDEPLIKAQWLPEQGLFLAVHSNAVLYEPQVFSRMNKVITDNMIRFGALVNKTDSAISVYAQQAEICTGQKIGRLKDDENITAFNLGLPLHGIYIGRKIYEVAVDQKIGKRLAPLTW